jgi:hypothetical protein
MSQHGEIVDAAWIRACAEHTERRMNRHLKDTCGSDTYACGLCQCGVPCTDHAPAPEEG